MNKRNSKKTGTSETVTTPGGPRAKSRVHAVKPGQAVRMEGTNPVIVRDSDAGDGDDSSATNMRDLVMTPGGLRPRSMIHFVEPGHALRMVEREMHEIDLRTGRVVRVHKLNLPTGQAPALGSGWITYAYWNNGTGNSISSFRTTWIVPPEPSTKSNQLIYLFNGIQNYGANYGILQPVLQWGASGGGLGGGKYWSVANWYVTSGGDAFHSQHVQVNVGDALTGVMTRTGQSGGTFSYTSNFDGVANVSLSVQNIAELLWCNETLEVYGLNDCDEYPDTLYTAFRKIEIKTGNTTPAVNWTPVDKVTDCGQHAVIASDSGSDGQVDLYYRRRKSPFETYNYASIVRNFLLLWLYQHGWEDPGWGQSVAGQAVAAATIYEMANQLQDRSARAEIQHAAGRALQHTADKMAHQG